MSAILSQLSHELEDLVAKTAPSVVAVEQGRGQGTGVVIAGDGYVLTNSHVARGDQRSLRVRLPSGEELSAELVGDDPESDLAVLHVNARGMVHEWRHPLADPLRLVASPLKLHGTPVRADLPPPLLGQHTDDVLRELLGLDDARISALRAQEVI